MMVKAHSEAVWYTEINRVQVSVCSLFIHYKSVESSLLTVSKEVTAWVY